MSKPKAPKTPDPKETAAAQTAQNVGTAIANTTMGQVNQVTPDGSLTYNQTGTYKWTDPNSGQVYDLPTYTATQTLSDAQQRIKDQTDAAELNMGQIANNQSAFLKDYLSRPVDLNNEETEARLMELGRKRLDPVLAQNEETFKQSLYNRGIREGSTAWDREMNNLMQGRNDAYNQLVLSGRQQAVQERLTERNQPINEIAALLSGSQVSQPNFIPTQTSNIPTTDIAGITQQNFANQMARYQQKMGAYGNLMGGLFSLGGKATSYGIS